MASSPGDASAGTPSPRRHVIVTSRATAEHRRLDAVRISSNESQEHVNARRHGLMLVGPTGGGKSRNLHVLEDTLGQLKVLGEQGFAYEKVKIYQLNPKSITMGPRRGVEVELQR